MAQKTPNYRSFLVDLQKLCKKHGVRITATDEGFVGVGPWEAKTSGEFLFNKLTVGPKGVELGDPVEIGSVAIRVASE